MLNCSNNTVRYIAIRARTAVGGALSDNIKYLTYQYNLNFFRASVTDTLEKLSLQFEQRDIDKQQAGMIQELMAARDGLIDIWTLDRNDINAIIDCI